MKENDIYFCEYSYVIRLKKIADSYVSSLGNLQNLENINIVNDKFEIEVKEALKNSKDKSEILYNTFINKKKELYDQNLISDNVKFNIYEELIIYFSNKIDQLNMSMYRYIEKLKENKLKQVNTENLNNNLNLKLTNTINKFETYITGYSKILNEIEIDYINIKTSKINPKEIQKLKYIKFNYNG